MLTGATQLVGLIGANVEHSRSIELHNRAFVHAGLDWRYVGLPVRPDGLEAAIRGLAALGFKGVNVTMPFKEAVIPLLDDVTPEARAIGAVNTVRVTWDGRVVGANTDAEGFLRDLADHHVSLNRPVHVLGAGGAARAVSYALAEAGVGSITVINRTERRAHALVQRLGPLFPRTRFVVAPWPEAIGSAPSNALIVNCTCVGMEGTDVAGETPWPSHVSFSPSQVVVDLVYAPVLTPILQKAKSEGAVAVSGLGMLVQQAALAFSWWTDTEAPITVMQHAAQSGGAA